MSWVGATPSYTWSGSSQGHYNVWKSNWRYCSPLSLCLLWKTYSFCSSADSVWYIVYQILRISHIFLSRSYVLDHNRHHILLFCIMISWRLWKLGKTAWNKLTAYIDSWFYLGLQLITCDTDQLFPTLTFLICLISCNNTNKTILTSRKTRQQYMKFKSRESNPLLFTFFLFVNK